MKPVHCLSLKLISGEVVLFWNLILLKMDPKKFYKSFVMSRVLCLLMGPFIMFVLSVLSKSATSEASCDSWMHYWNSKWSKIKLCSFISMLEFSSFCFYSFVQWGFPLSVISLCRQERLFLTSFLFCQTLAYLCGVFSLKFCWYGILLVFPFCLCKNTGTTQSISGNSLATLSILPCISCLKLDYLCAITMGSFCSLSVLWSLAIHSMALYFRISYSFPVLQPTYFIMHLVCLTIPTIQMNHLIPRSNSSM